MIYFVYGIDTYRLKKTVDAMRAKYEDSSGMNSSIFDGDYNLEKMQSDILSLPFIADKRLVIVKNILGAKVVDGKKVIEIIDAKPNSTVILFIEEGEPDKRTVLYKRLVKEKSKELNLLQGMELVKWIKAEAEKSSGIIENKEANILAGYYGGDLWQLKNEIQKLVSFDKEITAESIEKLSVANINVKIFDLIDAITAGNKEKAFKVLGDLLDSGENELYILSMIQWQMRNLALVYSLKNLSEREISSQAKMNPYIVKKTLSVARRVDSKDIIKKYYQQIIETENDIKTGAKEPDVALELLVNQLTG